MARCIFATDHEPRGLSEINEIEARVAAQEAQDPPPPVPPPRPAPEVQIVFLPSPAEEVEEGEETDNEAPVPGAGVGDFVVPSIKSSFMKRASLKSTETRSSVFAKAGKLSAQDLLKLSEQCSALVFYF